MVGGKVALVTGGASGMGLSVVGDLVRKGWNVAIVDLDSNMGKEAESKLGDQVHFVRANVADYDQQAAAFVETWAKWGRLDFVFANAGILDRTDFTAPMPATVTGAPGRPDVLAADICFYGPVWSAYLALHFFRRNTNGSGKLVITSSQGGIYPSPMVPVYSAAKTGVVGFTRSLGQRLEMMREPITVNCILPGLVATPLANAALLAAYPKDMVTPDTVIVKAVNNFLEDPSLTAQVAECSGQEIFYREILPYSNAAAEYMSPGKLEGKIDFGAALEDVELKTKLFNQKLNGVA